MAPMANIESPKKGISLMGSVVCLMTTYDSNVRQQIISAMSADRKSVVEGKSVDLGGRRIIKEKTGEPAGGDSLTRTLTQDSQRSRGRAEPPTDACRNDA